MKALPWIIAGIGFGAGLSFLLFTDSKLTGSSPKLVAGRNGIVGDVEDNFRADVETVARKTYGWGTKTRIGTRLNSTTGAIRHGVGRFTGNNRLAVRGTADRIVGSVKDKVGRLGVVAGNSIHEFNRS
jgi:uncharacterized protein YjbJ (UPF0337 family)